MYSTIKELKKLSNSFEQNSGEYVWVWILKVLGGRNIKLPQAEFINMDLLSGDPWFNKEVDLVKKK